MLHGKYWKIKFIFIFLTHLPTLPILCNPFECCRSIWTHFESYYFGFCMSKNFTVHI